MNYLAEHQHLHPPSMSSSMSNFSTSRALERTRHTIEVDDSQVLYVYLHKLVVGIDIAQKNLTLEEPSRKFQSRRHFSSNRLYSDTVLKPDSISRASRK